MLDFQIVTRLRIVSKIIGKDVYLAYIYRCANVYLNNSYKVLFATNWKYVIYSYVKYSVKKTD